MSNMKPLARYVYRERDNTYWLPTQDQTGMQPGKLLAKQIHSFEPLQLGEQTSVLDTEVRYDASI